MLVLPIATVSKQPWSIGGTFDVVFLEGEAAILSLIQTEAGGHRWQRVPPTERKGRMQTSTVTVAVLRGHQRNETMALATIPSQEIHERITKGTGPGGQNRNKRETAIILTHTPTGISVKAEAERTQEGNRRVAMQTLAERVATHAVHQAHHNENSSRKAQLGSGARGDKVRTYRSDGVTDHRSGKRAPLASIEAGKLELLS